MGPHGSTTPRAALRKLDADVIVIGECEETLCGWPTANAGSCPALPTETTTRSSERRPSGRALHRCALSSGWNRWPGTIITTIASIARQRARGGSRGLARLSNTAHSVRREFRRLPLQAATAAARRNRHALLARGVEYIYFIDEIFPNRPLLQALAERQMGFGVQTRIDLWKPEMLELLGRAGCVPRSRRREHHLRRRAYLDKDLPRFDRRSRGTAARGEAPRAFVQGNLIGVSTDEPADGADGARDCRPRRLGERAGSAVPLSRIARLSAALGEMDDQARERAHEHYLRTHGQFSDLQDDHPPPLPELERLSAVEA